MTPSVPTATVDSAADPAFAALLEELTNKCLAGEAVDWSAYQHEHPQHAEELRRLVPTMKAMADLGPFGAGELGSGPGLPNGMQATLGDFRLVRELGRGGMGVVYEAEQISLHRRVALKVLPLSGLPEAHQLQRFHNEAQAAACLNHEHVVPVYALGNENGVHYYAMQYVEGQSLDGVLRRLREERGKNAEPDKRTQGQPAPPPKETTIWENSARNDTDPCQPGLTARHNSRSYVRAIARLGVQACLALEHAHRQGVIHRDVKPGNLLIDRSGKLWLTDFGLALFPSKVALTRTGDLLGTLRYMSPEQASARGVVVDQRSDVYSLGVTLYEMLTLQPALPGDTHHELVWQVAHHDPVRPRRLNPTVPRELETILLKAMEKRVEDRYLTAQEFADDLQRFLEDKPISARRPGLARRLWKWVRRHRLAVATCTAVLVVVAVLTGMFEIGSARKRDAARRETMNAATEAALLQKGQKWEEALVAARRAYGLARAADLEQAFVDDQRRRLTDAEMAVNLEKARLQKAGGSELTLDFPGTDRHYREAFKSYELDVESDPSEIAPRIRAATIRLQLITAIDDWAYLRHKFLGKDGGSLWKLAEAADDDEWRRKLRAALPRQDGDALEELTKSTELRRQPPAAIVLLASALQHASRGAAAERLLRQAQWLHPGDFWINFYLASALYAKQPADVEGAARFYQAALALSPSSSAVCQNLGAALLQLRKPAEAEAAFREALRLEPAYAPGYCNLGVSLFHQGKLTEAEAAFRGALQVKPDFPPALNSLGNVFRYERRFPEAEAAYEKAISLLPNYAEAYYNLGLVYADQSKLPQAETAYRKATVLKPDYAEAHFALGQVLGRQNRFGDSLAAFRRGHALAPTRPDWPYPSDRWVREAERLVELEAKLPKILEGKAKPAKATEQIEMAQVCSRTQRHAAAARFFAEAFAAQPKGAGEPEAHRYSAACAAARAGCGHGLDAAKLDDQERSRLRRLALTWLHDELVYYGRQLEGNLEKTAPLVRERLGQWQREPAFAGVRATASLAKLPEEERRPWQELWEEVEASIGKVGSKVTP